MLLETLQEIKDGRYVIGDNDSCVRQRSLVKDSALSSYVERLIALRERLVGATPEEAVRLSEEIVALEESFNNTIVKVTDCKTWDISFGGLGYQCQRCGATDLVAGKIRHKDSRDADDPLQVAKFKYNNKKGLLKQKIKEAEQRGNKREVSRLKEELEKHEEDYRMEDTAAFKVPYNVEGGEPMTKVEWVAYYKRVIQDPNARPDTKELARKALAEMTGVSGGDSATKDDTKEEIQSDIEDAKQDLKEAEEDYGKDSRQYKEIFFDIKRLEKKLQNAKDSKDDEEEEEEVTQYKGFFILKSGHGEYFVYTKRPFTGRNQVGSLNYASLSQIKKQINAGEFNRDSFDSKDDEEDVFTEDPLTKKGEKIMGAMKEGYGEKKGEEVFYASKNKGTISGVDGGPGSGPKEGSGKKEKGNKISKLEYTRYKNKLLTARKQLSSNEAKARIDSELKLLELNYRDASDSKAVDAVETLENKYAKQSKDAKEKSAKKKGWYLAGANSDIFYYGPFSSKEEADNKLESFVKNKIIGKGQFKVVQDFIKDAWSCPICEKKGEEGKACEECKAPFQSEGVKSEDAPKYIEWDDYVRQVRKIIKALEKTGDPKERKKLESESQELQNRWDNVLKKYDEKEKAARKKGGRLVDFL